MVVNSWLHDAAHGVRLTLVRQTLGRVHRYWVLQGISACASPDLFSVGRLGRSGLTWSLYTWGVRSRQYAQDSTLRMSRPDSRNRSRVWAYMCSWGFLVVLGGLIHGYGCVRTGGTLVYFHQRLLHSPLGFTLSSGSW